MLLNTLIACLTSRDRTHDFHIHADCHTAVLGVLDHFKAPKWVFRTVACLVLGGQVMLRIFQGKAFQPFLRPMRGEQLPWSS